MEIRRIIRKKASLPVWPPARITLRHLTTICPKYIGWLVEAALYMGSFLGKMSRATGSMP
jgi:hypothetical protein